MKEAYIYLHKDLLKQDSPFSWCKLTAIFCCIWIFYFWQVKEQIQTLDKC